MQRVQYKYKLEGKIYSGKLSFSDDLKGDESTVLAYLRKLNKPVDKITLLKIEFLRPLNLHEN